jgi:hypothetical protein
MSESEGIKEAGHFELHSFIIKSYDFSKTFELKKIIHSFQIQESMKRGAIRGSAKMFDVVGLLQEFPLRGEEFIEISYSDFYGVRHVDKMFLYSISDVRQADPRKSTMWEYTMHFTSRPKVYSENASIMKAFAGPATNRSQGDKISEFVKSVHRKYYGEDITPSVFKNNSEDAVFRVKEPLAGTSESKVKPLIVQETDGNQRLVVPNLSPEQTMFFFAKRAYNASSFSQTYHFFENRQNYVFATNEYLQREAYAGVYAFSQTFEVDQTPEGQLELQSSIIDIDYGEIVNTIDDINGGGYVRTAYEIDPLHNVINKKPYSLVEEFEQNNPELELFHTKKFREERILETQDRWFIKDYATEGVPGGRGIRPNTYYADIYNKKGTYLYHTNRNKLNITIYGNNNIIAGSTVSLNIMKYQAESGSGDFQDKKLSGSYLVEEIDNNFYEDTYTQRLTLTRNGIGKDSNAT